MDIQMLKFKLTEFKQLIFAYSSLNFQRIPFIRTKFLRCMYFTTWMHVTYARDYEICNLMLPSFRPDTREFITVVKQEPEVKTFTKNR